MVRRGVPRRRAVDAEMSADDSQKPAHKPVGNLIIGSFSIGPCTHLGVCPLLALLRHGNTLRAALNHAVKDGQLRYAPFIPTLKVSKNKEVWLTQEEARRLYRAVLAKRWRYLNLFIRIAIGSGAWPLLGSATPPCSSTP